MNLRWKIGGGMAIIAALVSVAGSLAAYTSTDAELTQNVDNSLRDSAARVLNIPANRPSDGDNEDGEDGIELEIEHEPLYKGLTAEKNKTIIDIITSDKYSRDEKVEFIDEALTNMLPPLEGDPVTMIGSTFLTYGSQEPYFNHCIVLGDCAQVDGAVIESVPIVNGIYNPDDIHTLCTIITSQKARLYCWILNSVFFGTSEVSDFFTSTYYNIITNFCYI